MRQRERTLRSEQGAVFVQVGISLFVLMSFNVFVLDYGMMWIARRQAQNAADAGALAGAVARGYDDFGDDPSLALDIADKVVTDPLANNLVWQQTGRTVVTADCPTGVPGRCVRVEVFRDGTNGSTALPTLFGPILGITSQKVRASATAIVGSGNATDCLRPIAFADAWRDNSPNNQFNGYFETGPSAGQPYLPVGSRDIYTVPSSTVPGERTVLLPPAGDLGERIIYELDRDTISTSTPITRQLAVALTLTTGGGSYQSKIENCVGQVVQLGQTLPVFVPGGNPMFQAFNTVMAQDPGVDWNAGDVRIDNSCAPACGQVSPRLIAVALYDPDRFQRGRATGDWTNAGCPTAAEPCITVTNIVGMFVHGSFGGYGPHGHYLKYPGMRSATANPLDIHDDAAWLVTTHLIR